MKLTEGFFDTESVNEQEARTKKEELLKKKLEREDIDLSGMSDEDVDKALGLDDETTQKNLINMAIGSITESINEIVECMEAVNSSEKDIVEALSVHTGLKLTEAQEAYHDVLRERSTKKESLIDKLYESLNLAQKVDKEDAKDYDLKADKPVEAKVDKDGVIDPEKSLSDQKGEEIGEGDSDPKEAVNDIENPEVPDVEPLKDEYKTQDDAKEYWVQDDKFSAEVEANN